MNRKVLILIGSLFLILTLLLILVSSKKAVKLSPSAIPTLSPASQTSLPTVKVDFNIQSITPPKGTILKPNQPLEFDVTFDKPIDISWVGIKLSSGPISATQLNSTQFKNKVSGDNKTLIITSGPTTPSSQYLLEITNLTKNIKLLSINYPSDTFSTPAPSNNPALSTFLPYETANYKLSFNPDRNVYIFNFKYDTNSSVSIDDQYNQAKTDATAFIQSKGIDINSIVIEWRHS
jgi:hypothetical protein